jgi:Ger(x)C family germination protein
MNGCFNYRDLNKLLFATAVIIDIDEDKNIIIYGETFKAYRGQGEKQGTEVKVVFKGKGQTIYEAYNKIIESAGSEINYTQVRALIFSERAASYGIENFIDAPNRDQKPTLRQFLFIYLGDPVELMDISMPDEKFLGLFLDSLMVSQGKVASVSRTRLDKYLNDRVKGSRTSIIPILKIISVDKEKRIAARGAAIIEKDKMVDKINDDEVIAYNYVHGEAKTGFLTADNPDEKGKHVTLKVLKNNVKISASYDGKSVLLKKDIKVRVTLIESQKPIELSKEEVRRKIEKDAEDTIRDRCNELFYKFQRKGIDLYNVQRWLEMKHPKNKIENPLEITRIKTNVDVFLEGSNNTTDFR